MAVQHLNRAKTQRSVAVKIKQNCEYISDMSLRNKSIKGQNTKLLNLERHFQGDISL